MENLGQRMRDIWCVSDALRTWNTAIKSMKQTTASYKYYHKMFVHKRRTELFLSGRVKTYIETESGPGWSHLRPVTLLDGKKATPEEIRSIIYNAKGK